MGEKHSDRACGRVHRFGRHRRAVDRESRRGKRRDIEKSLAGANLKFYLDEGYDGTEPSQATLNFIETSPKNINELLDNGRRKEAAELMAKDFAKLKADRTIYPDHVCEWLEQIGLLSLEQDCFDVLYDFAVWCYHRADQGSLWDVISTVRFLKRAFVGVPGASALLSDLQEIDYRLAKELDAYFEELEEPNSI